MTLILKLPWKLPVAKQEKIIIKLIKCDFLFEDIQKASVTLLVVSQQKKKICSNIILPVCYLCFSNVKKDSKFSKVPILLHIIGKYICT